MDIWHLHLRMWIFILCNFFTWPQTCLCWALESTKEMGNCLSKYPLQFQMEGLSSINSGRRQMCTGPQTLMKAQSLGLCLRETNEILTPLYDRFPPQSSVLEKRKSTYLSQSRNSLFSDVLRMSKIDWHVISFRVTLAGHLTTNLSSLNQGYQQ